MEVFDGRARSATINVMAMRPAAKRPSRTEQVSLRDGLKR